MEKTCKDDKYLMSSVYNTLEILDLLSQHDELGLSEISKILNIGKASVFRMLYTLEKKNYVHKTSNSRYKLGIKFANYGSIVLDKQNMFSLVKPYLRMLSDRHNETTHLGVLDDDFNVVFLAKELSNSTIQMASRVGLKLPFYVTSMGKMIVANRLNEEMKHSLKNYKYKQYTDSTITKYDDLIERLNIIKAQGYAEDLEESEVGLVCYAAPVRDLTGNTIAAISISGPSIRMQKNKYSLLNSLIKTAHEISIDMGYNKQI